MRADATRASKTCDAPRNPQPVVRRGGGAAGRRAAGRQGAEAARHHARRRPALSSADRRRSSGSASPAAEQSLLGRTVILDADAVRHPRAAVRRRGPTRVFASDSDGNTIASIYFNNPGWAKKSLPMGEKRIVSGKLEAYGDEWQIIHPEVRRAGQGGRPGAARAGLSADRGHHQPADARAGRGGAGARAGACPNGSSRACAAREGWRPWRAALAEAHREPGTTDAAPPARL